VSEAKALLRRYIAQREELGERELVLGDLSAEEMVGLLAARSPAPVERPVARSTETATSVPESVELVQLGSLDLLAETARGCEVCGLAKSRTQVVFGEGNPQADLVVVGEAPGADEDRTGRPFVGRAGKLLDLLLASIGFPRDEVYICNVLKCRPPGNRNPEPDEIAACSPYLIRQIEMVAPRAILAVGAFPAQTLVGTTESIGRIRGTVQSFQGVPLVATYHPAALLRNSSWVRPVWEDLQRLRGILDAD
jgi:DNA polymerase